MISTIQLVTLLAVPLVVLGCEGECIVGITNEYRSLYSPVYINVFQDMANQIDAQIVPPDNRRQDAITYFSPILAAYNKVAYNGLEHAIFPSYFHGKCRWSNGTVPNGCPNPDCPVVCGTPGSMVHFFPELTRIVFDHVSGGLTNLTSPKSKSYQQLKKMVLNDAQQMEPRATPRSAMLKARRRATAEKKLLAIMKAFPAMMLAACGGSNLAQCSWERYMKRFILQYP